MSASDGRRELGAALGEANVAHGVGGEGSPVAFPGSAGDVAAALKVAREIDRAVVVGGADAAALTLDLGRMTQVLHLDETSLLVHAQAGITVAALEVALAAHGLSLGPAARRSGGRTVGALLSSPHPGEASPRGRLSDACAAVDGVLADGTVINTRLAPRRATGPDLARALLGARGATGVITAAWLRCLRRPPERKFAAFAFSAGAGAIEASQALLDRGARPSDLSLVDGPIAIPALETGELESREVLWVIALDGVAETVGAELKLASDLAGEHGARFLSSALAEAWFQTQIDGRFESFVTTTALAKAWSERGERAELSGFTAAGAALMSDRPAENEPDPLAAIRDAIARRLDPTSLFSRRKRT